MSQSENAEKQMLAILNKAIHDYMYSYEDFLLYMKEKLGDHWDDYIKFRDDNSTSPIKFSSAWSDWSDGDE